MHMFFGRKGFFGGPWHRRRAGLARHRPSLAAHAPIKKRPRQPDVSATVLPIRPSVRELSTGGAVEAPLVVYIYREQPLRPWARDQSLSEPRTSPSGGASFNIPGEQVDGMDVARREGPPGEGGRMVRAARARTFWKCSPTAYRGHSIRTRRSTGTREECRSMRTEHDPIRTRCACVSSKTSSRARTNLKKIDAAVRDIVTRRPNSPPTIRAGCRRALDQRVPLGAHGAAFPRSGRPASHGALASWIAARVYARTLRTRALTAPPTGLR